jgi:hypothetical protein
VEFPCHHVLADFPPSLQIALTSQSGLTPTLSPQVIFCNNTDDMFQIVNQVGRFSGFSNSIMMKNYSLSKRECLSFLVLLAGAVLLFWWRVWIPSLLDRMHFSDDILVKDYPTRLGLFRILMEGYLPLWDPWQFGGWPGFANCEAGLLYPFNWVLIPFLDSPQLAFQVTQWLVLLHFVIGGMGAYRLARMTGLSPVGAAMASIAYTFCGFHCAHKKHTNMFFTLVWLPWIFCQLEIWIRGRKPHAFAGVTALLALAYLAGHPQASLYITILLTARILHATVTGSTGGHFSFRVILKGMVPVVWVIGLAVALTMIQWLPLWELIQQGERSQADVFQSSTEFSLPPMELLDTLLPEVLNAGAQVEVFYWGSIPLLLVIYCLVRGTLESFYRFLTVTAVLSVLMSLGEYIFVYDLSYVLIPGVAWVRAPSRWIYFASLPIALLAGRGIDLLSLRREEEQLDHFKIFAFIALLWFGGFGLISLYILPNINPEERLRVVQAMIIQLLFSGTFLLSLFLYHHQRMSVRGVALLAIFLTWTDLGTWYRMFDLVPGAGGYAIDQNVVRIQNAEWSQRSKVFLGAGGNRTMYHGAAQGFRELDGQSPLTPIIHLQLREDTAIPFPMTPNYALLQMMGVGTILTDHANLAKPAQKVNERLFLLNDPKPRARIYHDFLYVEPVMQRALLKLQSFPFDDVLLISEAELLDEDLYLEEPIFPKPFLLASCSNQAVARNAILIIDGVDHFAHLGDEPGYYFAVLDEESGEVEDTAGFNLQASYADPTHPAHAAMTEFIEAIPEGKLVFAAIRDNAANVLFAEGLAALRAIGASADVRSGYQMAHAILGKKGAPIGSAVEVFNATEALILQTNQSLTIQGTVVAKPQVEYHATLVQATEWFELKEKLIPPISGSVTYAPGNGMSEEDSPFPPIPVVIYSVPKQSDARAALRPTTDRAHIIIRGKDYSPNKVGYNIVVMNPVTEEVVDVENFNLFKDYDQNNRENLYVKNPPEENLRFQSYIQSVTDGFIIMGAIRDDGTDLIQQETLETFRLFGSSIEIDITDDINRKNISHAFIGVKGSTQCLEVYQKGTEAIIYTRYPGGPVLMAEDLANQSDYIPSISPMQEIIHSASDTSLEIPGIPSKTWGVEEQGPNVIVTSGHTRNGGMLFLNEIFYPGWKAAIDGLTRPIHRVNYYFRGVWVPPGLHEVEYRYEPETVRIGTMVSFSALLVFLLQVILARIRRRKPLAPSGVESK